MAYESFPWDGISVGHAASGSIFSAPYTSTEYANAYSRILASYAAEGFVIPLSYAPNGLALSENSPAAMNVLVSPGAIYIMGRICESTVQETLTIAAADATNPRIDRIVARVNLSTLVQTWELAVLTGTPGAAPSLPSLTQNATTYEVAIGHVWVAALATTITAFELHDERTFANTFDNYETRSLENSVPNSEFIGFSSYIAGAGNTDAPDMWTITGSPSQIIGATKPSQMSRGRAIQITSDAASEGIRTFIPVKGSTTYVVKCLVYVVSGAAGISLLTDGTGATEKGARIRRTGSWIEETVIFTTVADATYVQLALLAVTNPSVVRFGQVLLVEGYIPGAFRQEHEMIMCNEPITDTSWDGDAKSTGTTNIDLDTSYGGLIHHKEVRALYLLVRARDSGSAAGAAALNVEPTASSLPAIINQLDTVGNDITLSVTGWVQLNKFSGTNHLQFHAFATGAGTLDATIEIWGMMT